MNVNMENFKKLISDEKTDTVKRNKERIKNRKKIRESQSFAIKVLNLLDDNNWTHEQLSKENGIPTQKISKIIKGKYLFDIKALS